MNTWWKNMGNGNMKPSVFNLSTVIPQLAKIIRSGITFVSRNVFISAPGMARPFIFAALC